MKKLLTLTLLVLTSCAGTKEAPVAIMSRQNIAGILKPTITPPVAGCYFNWQVEADANIDHFNIYWGFASHSYEFMASTIEKFTVMTNWLENHAYYVAVTQVDTDGIESEFSNEVKCQSDLGYILKFNFSTTPSNAQVEATVDLINWTPRSAIWLSAGTDNSQVFFVNKAGNKSEFYRATSQLQNQ